MFDKNKIRSKKENYIEFNDVNIRPRDWHIVFIFSSLSFIFGLAVGNKLTVELVTVVWVLSLWLVLILALVIFSSSRQKIIYFGLVIGVGLFGGLFRSVTQADYRFELNSYLNKKIEIRAEIVAEPDEREILTKLVVRPVNYRAKILVTAERYPQYYLGDIVSLRGKIVQPKNIFSADGVSFDYQTYLAKDGIYYEIYKPQIILVSRPTFGLFIFLTNLKSRLIGIMNSILPEPESSLLAGILLGARKSLGMDITNDFRLAGLSHILVLSGYNITFVALILLRACALLPRLVGSLVGFISIIAFGLLAGGGSVVWRAVLMSLIALYAKLVGRMFDVTVGIIFSVVALIAYNPTTLTADLGFQLSIMAMVGIVYISPMLKEKVFYRLPVKFGLSELVSSTFGAQLAVLPLLWQVTGQVSVVGFVSNLIILPFVPYTMMTGAIAVSIGFFSLTLAWPTSVITYFLLKMILILANLFARLPLAGLVVVSGSWWFVFFLYLLIFWPVVRYWTKRELLEVNN